MGFKLKLSPYMSSLGDGKRHGALRHHHHVGSIGTALAFAQAASGEEKVARVEAAIICEQHLKLRLHVAMLECVVEQDDGPFVSLQQWCCHQLNTLAPILTHTHYGLRKVPLYLQRFIAYLGGTTLHRYLPETNRPTSVAAT